MTKGCSERLAKLSSLRGPGSELTLHTRIDRYAPGLSQAETIALKLINRKAKGGLKPKAKSVTIKHYSWEN